MPPPRPVAGQASAEYVALLAVVGAVVAGAAATGSPPALAGKVAGAVRHGICLVAGGVCTPREARAAGLAPCLVQARTDRERLGGRVLVVRLGRGDTLLVERRSDGTASVSFADSGAAGAVVSLGLRLPTGPRVGVTGGAGLTFAAGRSWEFRSFAEAARFVRRWASRESLGGELRGALRAACPFCRGRRPMPPPDARYVEGGGYGEFAAALRGPGGAGPEEEGEASAVAGRRLGPGGRVTWYDRLDAETAGRLGLVLGALEAHQAGEAALEVTTVHGRPLELRIRAAARVHGDLALSGPAASVADIAAALRGAARSGRGRSDRGGRDGDGNGNGDGGAPGGAPRGAGRRVEAEVALDLTDARNRRALLGVVEVLRLRVSPRDWGDRVRALAARLDADGAVDVRVFRIGFKVDRLGAEGALGLAAGGAYRRTQEVRTLLRAWSARGGGGLREREDCAPA